MAKVNMSIGTAAMTVELPMEIKSEANSRDHWAKKAKRVKQQRTAAWGHVRSFAGLLTLVAAGGPITITLTRVIGKGGKAYDGDNLESAFKAVRDGVADALQINDRSPRLTWDYSQTRGAAAAVRIQITSGVA